MGAERGEQLRGEADLSGDKSTRNEFDGFHRGWVPEVVVDGVLEGLARPTTSSGTALSLSAVSP